MVKCPDEWEIYSSMPGSKKANAAITDAALKVAEHMLAKSKEHDVGPKMVMKLVQEHITPVFKKYQKYGTFDTEPRANMANYLARYAKELGSDADEAIYEAVRWGI